MSGHQISDEQVFNQSHNKAKGCTELYLQVAKWPSSMSSPGLHWLLASEYLVCRNLNRFTLFPQTVSTVLTVMSIEIDHLAMNCIPLWLASHNLILSAPNTQLRGPQTPRTRLFNFLVQVGPFLSKGTILKVRVFL